MNHFRANLSASFKCTLAGFLLLFGSSYSHGQIWKKVLPIFDTKQAEKDTMMPMAEDQLKTFITQDVQALSSPDLGARIMGTKGAEAAGRYIGKTMNSFGVIPYDHNFIHTFWYVSGKHFTPETRFNIGRDYIFIPEEAFPTPYSGTGSVQNYILPDSREMGQPWIIPLYENQRQADDPDFDWIAHTFKRAKMAAGRGASAVIFYDNYGSRYVPKYIKTAAQQNLDIPVLILTHKAYAEKVRDIKSLTTLYLNIKFKDEQAKAANIIGYIDNGAPMDVLIGAHYDGAPALGGIPAAAGDNTSGVAAMISLARILKKGHAKQYNYILAAFSGGMAGQLGSKALLQDKSFDASKVAYVINLDRVGGLNKSLYVDGVTSASAWVPFFKEPAPALEYHFEQEQKRPSDNLTFLARQIPTLSFSTNINEEAGGQQNRLRSPNVAGIQKMVTLVYRLIVSMNRQPRPSFATAVEKEKIAYELAHRNDIPVVKKEPAQHPPVRKAAPPSTPKRVVHTPYRRSRQGASVGIVCDTAYDGYGVRILSVKQAAQKAGLAPGDIIMQVNEKKINHADDYREVIQALSPGEALSVKVKRGVTVQEFTLISW